MRSWELALLSLFIVCSGIFGAGLSKYAKETGNIYPYFVSGVFTIISWIWTVKRFPHNLVVSAIYWDILYNAAWIGWTIVALKESSSVWQSVGAVVVFVGLVIMGL